MYGGTKKNGEKLQQGDQKCELRFTDDEIKRFEIRFENGYDLQNDERYNAWLKARSSGSYHTKQDGKSPAQDYSSIESSSLSLLYCPSALDLEEPVTSFETLFDENKHLYETG